MNIYGSVLPLAILLYCTALVMCKSYYTIIAPGVIKSNRNFTVSVSLHEADEPAVINVRFQGPSYSANKDVYLQPYQTSTVKFLLPKLIDGEHRLIAEGVSGIEFRNESKLYVRPREGPKIYIQTDKAVYKPGDVIQFRCLLLDEHTRPLRIKEPIRVEIFDGNHNRVKQFKDIPLNKGVYKGSFELSQHPVEGRWEIKVTISGKYDFSNSKIITVKKYVLPKFSVYIEADPNYFPDDGFVKAKVYGKYTFDKYVEGNLTANVWSKADQKLLQQKQLEINAIADLEFRIDKAMLDLDKATALELRVELTERHTGESRSESENIYVRRQRYEINVDLSSIKYLYHTPYLLTAHVRPYNASVELDRATPVIMVHGSKEYSAHLDSNGDAVFKFAHERIADHVFRYKDSTYTLPNIYVNEERANKETLSYCQLRLKGDRPRLGTNLEIEVSSKDFIPYINYVVVSHGNIMKTGHIKMAPQRKSYTIQLIPSIEMIPYSFIYVYYIQNGELRYEEMVFSFPWEFENRISVIAPKKVGPGQNVTIELKAQPTSLVGLLAVDLGVFLLDSSYDLKRDIILSDLASDVTSAPIQATVYPGLVSGVLTLTNAHYLYVDKPPEIGNSGANPDFLTFRRKFPETWIFDNYNVTNESTKLELTVPDTITTWRLTAFTVHDVTGFGIVDGPTDIISIQTFFIVLNLPYAVKRGEIVPIPVLVHNYHNQSVEAEITMYNQEKDFYFLESRVVDTEGGSEEQQRVKRVMVPANGVGKVEFLINPKRVGNINLQLTAENPLSRDAVIQQLKVEPEGVVKRESKAVYASLSGNSPFSHNFTVDAPKDIVPDSEFITLTAGGDSLVPTLKNLNNLVSLPTGCGEQNMVNFVPNILVLEYLKSSGNYFTQRSLVQKAKKFIEIGFQQQMSYRHSNGGYSVFGQKTDSEASTWLTAYVIRFFIRVSPYLSIQPHIITSGLDFLAGKQFEGGDFPYTGYLFYPAQQNRYGFTAFVLMTFLENQRLDKKYPNTIQKGLTFLTSNFHKIEDVYALSITAAALQMAKHESAQKALDKLQVSKKQNGNHTWWSQDDTNREKDVEITAYVLMALLDSANDPSENLSILKWLVDQRNPMGGFKSTHDTVVGLQALVKFSQKYGNARNMNLKVKYTAKKKQGEEILTSGELLVNGDNMLVLQNQELPSSTRLVNISVTGSGYSLIQLSYQYNVAVDDTLKHFQIQPKPQLVNDNEMMLEVCFDYVANMASTPDSIASSNMIIMEANLPTGFIINRESGNELLENEIVQRFESKNADTTMVIYFEKLKASEEHCLYIRGDKFQDILKRKPAAIAVYDYYNISRHNTVFYAV